MTALVIRTVYNNQDWAAPCKTPGKDKNCKLCFEKKVQITPPSPEGEICTTDNCWERNLCVQYRWGRTPKGQKFGGRAQEGVRAFFVYRQLDGKYTLWGVSAINAVDDKTTEVGSDDEKGYAFVHFNPFKPLPREKWVKDLTDRQLVGKKWGQGSFRYVDSGQEAYLEQLIEGISPSEAQSKAEDSLRSSVLSISIMPSIQEKLQQKAISEGRQVDEVVREAIAEWLKDRER